MVKKNVNKKLVVTTEFWDPDGNDVDPLSLLNRNCNIKPCIYVESIYVGLGPSVQIKVTEGQVRLQAVRAENPKLMSRPKRHQGDKTEEVTVLLVDEERKQQSADALLDA